MLFFLKKRGKSSQGPPLSTTVKKHKDVTRSGGGGQLFLYVIQDGPKVSSQLGRMTLSITTFSLKIVSITILNTQTATLSIITLSEMVEHGNGVSFMLSIIYAECHLC